MKFTTKLLLCIIAVITLIVAIYQGYLTVRYRLHNGHLAVLSEHEPFSAGSEFRVFDANLKDIPKMVCVAESAQLRLYIEEETGNIAIFDKRNQSIIYSVHPDMEDDPIASGFNKSLLQSQLSINYFTSERVRAQMNSYDHALYIDEQPQIELQSIADGVRVIYTMGDTSSPTGIVPVYITEERLEMFFGQLQGREYSRNRALYEPSTVAPGHLELRENVRTGQATLRELEALFISVGYTEADFNYDMEGSGVEGAVPLHFVIPVDFTLKGDSLTVSVNTAGIREYAGGRIDYLQLMRGFAAGSMDEEGYLVVPNGSGSLIHFNNQKTYADEYMQYIYGEDPMLSDYITLGNIEDVRIPFFGIEAESRTILGRIESGDSHAYLIAGISEKFSSYNYVYPGFVLRGSLALAMFGMTGNESTLPIVERDLPMINLTVRYSILEEKGYSGMAAKAREQLIEEGMLRTELLPQDDKPFYMDLVGSVMGQKFFAGVRYMGQIPMTTYSQAAEIVEDLSDNGVTRQVVNYSGWFNRGYYHDVADKIKPVNQLGRVRELEELARAIEAEGGKLYSDTSLLTIPWSSRRYRWELESTRYYGGGMVGGFGLINPITLYSTFSLGYLEVMYNAMSPRFLTRYMDDYIRAFDKYDLTGTSLRDMGSYLASDRRRTGMIHREEAKEVVLYNMEKLYNEGDPLMITGGNMYALRYTTDLINMPLAHNSLYIVDEEIPFYQMIIHGRIDYAGMPINLSADFDKEALILRLIEYGASPHFAFTYESANEMKYTGLNWKYSTRYENWRESAIEVYHAVNEVLKDVSGAEMTMHEILPDGLRVITYSNGAQIFINRTQSDCMYEDYIIPAGGYYSRTAGIGITQ